MHRKLEKFDTHNELVTHRNGFLGKYNEHIPEFVYGGIDGAVTTFAVVAASAGAELSSGVILILGISNMLADGLSMSIGSFLATKSEIERYENIQAEEYEETKKFPKEEIQEIRDIYQKKGFKGKTLEDIVTHITNNSDLWVEEMMVGEHGMIRENKDPKMNGAMTFVSFCILGAIPISPYFYSFVTGIRIENKFVIACIFTAFAFGAIGYLKGIANNTNKTRAIIETLVLGGIAAGVAYFVGDWLEKLIA